MSNVRGVVKSLTLLFLGLNLAWMELAFDMIVVDGPGSLMGWTMPVVGMIFTGTAVQWFWLHFVLTIVSVSVLIIIYETRGEK